MSITISISIGILINAIKAVRIVTIAIACIVRTRILVQ